MAAVSDNPKHYPADKHTLQARGDTYTLTTPLHPLRGAAASDNPKHYPADKHTLRARGDTYTLITTALIARGGGLR